jgi:hypothetical protein
VDAEFAEFAGGFEPETAIGAGDKGDFFIGVCVHGVELVLDV